LIISEGPAISKEAMAAHIMEYESAAVMGKLFQLSMEYYHHICSSDDANEEKACLIPICALRTKPVSQFNKNSEGQEDITITNSNGKRVRNLTEDDSQTSFSMLSTSEATQPQLKKYRETNDDTTMLSKDVDDALFILNSASLCFQHLAETSQWAKGMSPDLDTINWDNCKLL
jgi:hypothetical protein